MPMLDLVPLLGGEARAYVVGMGGASMPFARRLDLELALLTCPSGIWQSLASETWTLTPRRLHALLVRPDACSPLALPFEVVLHSEQPPNCWDSYARVERVWKCQCLEVVGEIGNSMK